MNDKPRTEGTWIEMWRCPECGTVWAPNAPTVCHKCKPGGLNPGKMETWTAEERGIAGGNYTFGGEATEPRLEPVSVYLPAPGEVVVGLTRADAIQMKSALGVHVRSLYATVAREDQVDRWIDAVTAALADEEAPDA